MDSDTLKLLNAYDRATLNDTADETDEALEADKTQKPDVISDKDSDIIKAFLERDEKAVSAAMAKYGKNCLIIARRFLKNQEDAEQCVNDVLAKTWESIPPNRPKELMPYLARITKNTALNKLRSDNSLKRGGGVTAEIFEELEECVSGGSGAEERADENALKTEIDRFLGTLRPGQRKIFLLRYWFCCDIGEIAMQTGRSKNNVTVTLTNIRSKFRSYLQKRGYDL